MDYQYLVKVRISKKYFKNYSDAMFYCKDNKIGLEAIKPVAKKNYINPVKSNNQVTWIRED